MIGGEAEFAALMEEVDRLMAAEGLPIPVRPMKALSVMSRFLNEPLRGVESGLRPHAGAYAGDDLSARVRDWYVERYGETLKWRVGPGRSVVLLRGALWVLHLPLIYGQVRVVVDPCDPAPPAGSGRPNLLNSIESLPAGLRADLSQAECRTILRRFEIGRSALDALCYLGVGGLVSAARSDHEIAVDAMLGPRAHFGNSRWASLQAVEKLLKEYISRFRPLSKKDKNHDLDQLATEAERAGLGSVSRLLLQAVSCSVKVRYGEVAVARNAAIGSHYAALRLTALLATAIDALP